MIPGVTYIPGEALREKFNSRASVSDEQLIFRIRDEMLSALRQFHGTALGPGVLDAIKGRCWTVLEDVSQATSVRLRDELDFALQPSGNTVTIAFSAKTKRAEKMIRLLMGSQGVPDQRVQDLQGRIDLLLSEGKKAQDMVREATQLLLEKYGDEQDRIDAGKKLVDEMETEMHMAGGAIDECFALYDELADHQRIVLESAIQAMEKDEDDPVPPGDGLGRADLLLPPRDAKGRFIRNG